MKESRTDSRPRRESEAAAAIAAAIRRPGWRADAACRGMSAEIFYEVAEAGGGRGGSRPSSRAALAEVKAICADCRVRAECLAEALSTSQPRDFGVWGGTTPAERRRIRREIDAYAARGVQRSAGVAS